MKAHNNSQKQATPKLNPKISQAGAHRPENKDNLDSRKNEEWQKKDDDITHNEKKTHVNK